MKGRWGGGAIYQRGSIEHQTGEASMFSCPLNSHRVSDDATGVQKGYGG